MTVTVSFFLFAGLGAAAALVGFLFGVLAMAPKPAREPEPAPPPAVRLPRAGYLVIDDPYPTVPVSLESEHAAQLARTQGEIRDMIRAAESRWPHYIP